MTFYLPAGRAPAHENFFPRPAAKQHYIHYTTHTNSIHYLYPKWVVFRRNAGDPIWERFPLSLRAGPMGRWRGLGRNDMQATCMILEPWLATWLAS